MEKAELPDSIDGGEFDPYFAACEPSWLRGVT